MLGHRSRSINSIVLYGEWRYEIVDQVNLPIAPLSVVLVQDIPIFIDNHHISNKLTRGYHAGSPFPQHQQYSTLW